MAARAEDRHIEIAPGHAGDEPHVAGHRIKVRDIALWHERSGRSADEIDVGYDLDLADVSAALAYSFDHREEIADAIARHRDFVEEPRRRTPS